jgi:hypothetical protein
LQLEGQQQQLVDLLMRMTDPVLLQQQLAKPEVFSGAAEVEVVLHQPGKFPAGALGLAKMMWHWKQQQQQHDQKYAPQQLQQQGQQKAATGDLMQIDAGAHQQQQQQQHGGAGAGSGRWKSKQQRKQQQQGQQTRVIWLWCHASYYKQVHDILQQAVHEMAREIRAAAAAAAAEADTAGAGSSKVLYPAAPTVASLCSSLRRLELVGLSADDVICKVITQQQDWQRQADSSGSSAVPDRRSTQNSIWTAVAAAVGSLQLLLLPPGCVLGVVAVDPRLAKPVRHQVPSGAVEPDIQPQVVAGGDAMMPTVKDPDRELAYYLQGWPGNGESCDG